MKRIICLVTGILVCIIISACNTTDQHIQTPVTYYYQTATVDYKNPNGIITSEIQESAGYEEDFIYLTKQYLKGPTSSECISPFPDGTQLERLTILDDSVIVVLNTQFSELTGHKLTIACSCLSKTLSEMTGLDTVTISAKDTLLDGMPSITMTKNDFILTDDNQYIPDET